MSNNASKGSNDKVGGGKAGGDKAGVDKGPPKSARRRARELALQGLYQWLLAKEDRGAIEAHLHDSPGFERADKAHFSTLLNGAIMQKEALDAAMLPSLDREITALSPVEHAALLIGTYELSHHVEVPYRVVINEAVELTKSYGGVDGYKYVNGVLDKVAARVRVAEFEAAARGRV